MCACARACVCVCVCVCWCEGSRTLDEHVKMHAQFKKKQNKTKQKTNRVCVWWKGGGGRTQCHRPISLFLVAPSPTSPPVHHLAFTQNETPHTLFFPVQPLPHAFASLLVPLPFTLPEPFTKGQVNFAYHFIGSSKHNGFITNRASERFLDEAKTAEVLSL